MSTCYVIVGLIGVGKTTLAEAIDAERIDFDKEWEKWSKNNAGRDGFAIALGKRLDALEHSDVVIDGWWTWEVEWWKIEGDETLSLLAQNALFHRIQLVYLPMPFSAAQASFVAKRNGRKGLRGWHGKPENYKASIPDRAAYIEERVAEWAQ